MPTAAPQAPAPRTKLTDRRVVMPAVLATMQVLAASYLVFDGVDDFLDRIGQGITAEIVMECVVAIALLGGVVLSAHHIRQIDKQLNRQQQALAVARGALADHIAIRFEEWGLTPGENEVALFALKGCDVAEIARLRGAASGTVRSQLSQIYAKAGVSSQAMLVSLFIEDLLDGTAVP